MGTRRILRALLPPLALLAPAAGDARAAGVNFNWGTVCYTEAPASLRTFACDTNVGVHPMTLSFVIDSGMPDMVGLEITVEGVSDAAELPDWWKLAATQCRAGGMGYSGNNAAVADETCADWNGGAGFDVPPGITWQGNRVRVTTGHAIEATAPYDLPAGIEHYAGTLSVRNIKTVGTDACAGCGSGFTWWVSNITVAGLSGRRDELTLAMPGGNQFLYWNRPARTASTLALVSEPMPSAYLAPVTLTATVTPPGATGVVEFVERDSTLGSAPVTGTGTATLSVGALAEGDHAITAAYGGDAAVERAFSPVLTHTVTPRPASTVALTSSPNPSAIGQPVRLRAVVSPPGATGLMTFRDGGALLTTVTVRADTAVLDWGNFYFGNHAVTAAYGGDATHAPATSPVVGHAVLDHAPTTVRVTVRPEPSRLVEMYREVLAWVSPVEATGTVTLTLDGVVVGAAVDNGGQAAFGALAMCGGPHTLVATYGGDLHYLPSTSEPYTHTVLPAATTTALTQSAGCTCVGEAVTFTAQVSRSVTSECPWSGTVELAVDGEAYGLPVPVAESVTFGPLADLPPGAHSVHAVYSGCANYLGSTSSHVTHVVLEPDVTVTVSPSPSCIDEPVLFRAALCSATGLVQFLADGEPLGSPAPIVSGIARLAGITGLPPGMHSIRVVYPCPAGACTSSATMHLVVGADPLMIGVADAANDQGGFVDVTWAPGCSVEGLAEYWIQRWNGATSEWEYVGSHPAFETPTDYVRVATASDSVAGSNPYTTLRVMALWEDGRRFYSAPDSGYSVDNVAPAAPVPFVATHAADGNHVAWAACRDQDFAEYHLHRVPVIGDIPGPENLLSVQAGTGYDDPGAGSAFYMLCAVDVHGNRSPYVTAVATQGTPTGVPDGALALGLERVAPHPSRGNRLRVSFTLPETAPARLRVFDVSGRQWTETEVGSAGAGRHVADLGTGFAPGVYVVRLTQGTASRSIRIAVLE